MSRKIICICALLESLVILLTACGSRNVVSSSGAPASAYSSALAVNETISSTESASPSADSLTSAVSEEAAAASDGSSNTGSKGNSIGSKNESTSGRNPSTGNSNISSSTGSKSGSVGGKNESASGRKPSTGNSSTPSASGTQESLINGAKLTPMRTGCEKLDKKVDEIFKKIHTPGMSAYGKVKACFDYLVKNGVYTRGDYVENPIEGILYDSDYDAMLVDAAYEILMSNKGVCDDYTAAFVVMTRAIGLESYYVGGQYVNSKGGKNGHAWANVKINGTYYIFDPQSQQNSSSPYFFFCKTDASLAKNYIYDNRDGYVKRFKGFSHHPAISASITVSGGGKTQSASWEDRENDYYAVDLTESFDLTDGMLHITVKPTGGRGKYRCIITGRAGYPEYTYVDEVISGEKTFAVQLKPDEYYSIVKLQIEDTVNADYRVRFQFDAYYPPA